MCSWGSPQKYGKFFKGAKTDTPWNNDLLWKYHVAKEEKQMNSEEMGVVSPKKKNTRRLKMGITGTLIPVEEDQPKCSDTLTLNRMTEKEEGQHEGRYDDVMSTYSSSTGSKARSKSSRHSSTSSCTSTTSSSMSKLKKKIEEASRLKDSAMKEELETLRKQISDESKKRENAEKKLEILCQKLGVEEGHL